MAVVVNTKGIPFWLVGEFTTRFRTCFSGAWDVHWARNPARLPRFEDFICSRAAGLWAGINYGHSLKSAWESLETVPPLPLALLVAKLQSSPPFWPQSFPAICSLSFARPLMLTPARLAAPKISFVSL